MAEDRFTWNAEAKALHNIMNPRTWQSAFLNEPDMALLIIHESKTQQRDILYSDLQRQRNVQPQIRPSSIKRPPMAVNDEKLLLNMIFGSLPLAHSTSSTKLHDLNNPARVLISKLYPAKALQPLQNHRSSLSGTPNRRSGQDYRPHTPQSAQRRSHRRSRSDDASTLTTPNPPSARSFISMGSAVFFPSPGQPLSPSNPRRRTSDPERPTSGTLSPPEGMQSPTNQSLLTRQRSIDTDDSTQSAPEPARSHARKKLPFSQSTMAAGPQPQKTSSLSEQDETSDTFADLDSRHYGGHDLNTSGRGSVASSRSSIQDMNSRLRRLHRSQSSNLEFGGRRHASSSQARYSNCAIALVVNVDGNPILKKFLFSHFALLNHALSGFQQELDACLTKLIEDMPAKSTQRNPFKTLAALLQQSSFRLRIKSFKNAVFRLYAAPRIQEPVWLTLTTYAQLRTATRRKMCLIFRDLFQQLRRSRKSRRFLTTAVTAVLQLHLGWISTIIPSSEAEGETLSRCMPKSLELQAKAHPYDSLWAQLVDLTGASTTPKRIGKTIVVGRNAALVTKLVYILTYFIRSSEVFELEVAAKRYALTPPERQLSVSVSAGDSDGIVSPQHTAQAEGGIQAGNANTDCTPPKTAAASAINIHTQDSASFDDTFYSAQGSTQPPTGTSFDLGAPDALPELDVSSVGSSPNPSLDDVIPDTSFLTAMDASHEGETAERAYNDDNPADSGDNGDLITSLAAVSFADEHHLPGIESSTPTSNGNAISEWLRRSLSASKRPLQPQETTPLAEPMPHLREDALTEIPLRTSLCLQVRPDLSRHALVQRLDPQRMDMYNPDAMTSNDFSHHFSLGRSLLIGPHRHYVNGPVLQALPSLPAVAVERDLKLAVSSPVEDSIAEEAATAVLNTDKFTCTMLTCFNPHATPSSPALSATSQRPPSPTDLCVKSTAIVSSPLVDTMVTTFAQLIELKVEDEAVLDVVEDHLHNIYQTAKTLALQVEVQVQRRAPKFDRAALAQSLGVKDADIPLLLSVARVTSDEVHLGMEQESI
eukprot:m.207052 g.207052  ORF g.207052 m.207052 type:complete len:1045 (+) comp17120_c0_seq2:63-3197(+)